MLSTMLWLDTHASPPQPPNKKKNTPAPEAIRTNKYSKQMFLRSFRPFAKFHQHPPICFCKLIAVIVQPLSLAGVKLGAVNNL